MSNPEFNKRIEALDQEGQAPVVGAYLAVLGLMAYAVGVMKSTPGSYPGTWVLPLLVLGVVLIFVSPQPSGLKKLLPFHSDRFEVVLEGLKIIREGDVRIHPQFFREEKNSSLDQPMYRSTPNPGLLKTRIKRARGGGYPPRTLRGDPAPFPNGMDVSPMRTTGILSVSADVYSQRSSENQRDLA